MTATPELITRLLKTLDRLSIPYAVGGSFASSAWGRPRQTLDLDLGVVISLAQVGELADATEGEYMLSRTEMEEAASGDAEFRSFQLLHLDEVFKIDVFALHPSAYTQELLARRRAYPLGEGYAAQFLSPEDIALTKLRWYVLGNRVSDRQWNDIVQVLEAQWATFDFPYAETWSRYFEVAEELELAKSQVVHP